VILKKLSIILLLLLGKGQTAKLIMPKTDVTGFAKTGLPHTSNSINLGDYKVAIGYQTTYKAKTFCRYPSILVLPDDHISSQ